MGALLNPPSILKCITHHRRRLARWHSISNGSLFARRATATMANADVPAVHSVSSVNCMASRRQESSAYWDFPLHLPVKGFPIIYAPDHWGPRRLLTRITSSSQPTFYPLNPCVLPACGAELYERSDTIPRPATPESSHRLLTIQPIVQRASLVRMDHLIDPFDEFLDRPYVLHYYALREKNIYDFLGRPLGPFPIIQLTPLSNQTSALVPFQQEICGQSCWAASESIPQVIPRLACDFQLSPCALLIIGKNSQSACEIHDVGTMMS
jgi:hypothetical protein